MAVNTTDLRVQLGKQSVWGTPVAATKLLRGVESYTLTPDIEVRQLEDMSLNYAGSTTAAVLRTGATGSMSGWMTFEQLPLWLDSLLEEDATPTGAGPYVYTYAPPIGSLGTQVLYTVQLADASDGGYALVGGLVNELTLTQEITEPMQFDVGFIANSAAADTLDSLSVPVVNPISAAQLATIYWDPWATAPGSTALANCYVRNFSLNINANRDIRYCYGSTAANDFRTDAYTAQLELTLEFNSTTKTDIDAIIGGTLTQKNVQLNWVDTANRGLTIDFAGTVVDMPDIFEDDDGISVVSVTLDRTYNSNWASPNWLAVEVTNEETDMFA